jgi:cystathionine beta-synthase
VSGHEAHYRDTGPELWRQLAGEIDVFVCGVGSGGTISGIGRYLKEQDRRLRVIGVERLHSAYRKLVTDRPPEGSFSTVVDDVVQVKDDDALDWCRCLARVEGSLAGAFYLSKYF